MGLVTRERRKFVFHENIFDIPKLTRLLLLTESMRLNLEVFIHGDLLHDVALLIEVPVNVHHVLGYGLWQPVHLEYWELDRLVDVLVEWPGYLSSFYYPFDLLAQGMQVVVVRLHLHQVCRIGVVLPATRRVRKLSGKNS